MFFLFKFASLYSHIHHNNSGRLSVNDEWGIRERNEGNDGNAGNQGGNERNQRENLRIRVELMNYNCGK